jgi:hypothetical protein
LVAPADPFFAGAAHAPVTLIVGTAGEPEAGHQTTGRLRSPRRDFGRVMRGALMTPWFAVSVGIVIATSLTLARPHPALTFPPSKTGRCAAAGCSTPSSPPDAPSPAIKEGAKLPIPRSDANVRLSGLKVEYQLIPGPRHGFIAVIVIDSRRRLGDWELSFALPGASIDHVMWAKWRHRGADGVVVTGSPLPWGESSDNEARIVVFGTGGPQGPTSCEFDGVSCTFRAMPKRADQKTALLHLGDGN